MNTILRLYFDPACGIFPDKYQGKEFIEITNCTYIPHSGCQVYFETAKYIDDSLIAGKIEKLMDYEGFKVNIWRVDYLEGQAVITGSLKTL